MNAFLSGMVAFCMHCTVQINGIPFFPIWRQIQVTDHLNAWKGKIETTHVLHFSISNYKH